jgi:hypothetical protein
MRRVNTVTSMVVGMLLIAAPASAFAHNRVHNPYLHAILDVLTLAVVSAPLWTAYLWGGRRRGLLIALVVGVQLPVAVIGFVPIVEPWLHGVALVVAFALTGLALWSVSRHTADVTVTAPSAAGRS